MTWETAKIQCTKRTATLLLTLCSLAILSVSPRAAQAADLAPHANQVTGQEINDRQRAAVEKGLAWLAAHQNANGSFGAADTTYGAQSAVSALSGLAFMSAGNLPDRGKYGQVVRNTVLYITGVAQESGLLSADSLHAVMYSHGFATLFLGEVDGMSGDLNDLVREKLQRAVRLIERTQNKEGGWRYQPVADDADISVTIAEIMALRSARDAGIHVDKTVIDKAIAYVERCQNPDGGFSYMANPGGGGSAFERSAAGVDALYYSGIFQGDRITRGLHYIARFRPGRNVTLSHYFYGQYYAVQAMFLAGGDYWKTWYPLIRDELCDRQQADGSWSGEISPEYCTAMALIVLQMPNRYLPVFNGKGPGD